MRESTQCYTSARRRKQSLRIVILRRTLKIAGILAVFAIGATFGYALSQGPSAGGKTTTDRTIRLVTITIHRR